MSGPSERGKAPSRDASRDAPDARNALGERLRRRRAKRSLMERVSIQSKLMLMLLGMSVLATAIAGGIGFQSGRTSLRAAGFDRLTSVREAQSRVLEMGLSDITGSLVIFSRGETASGALSAFSAAFDQLAGADVTPAQDRAIAEYYRERFSGAADSKLSIDALLPTSDAAKYLQANYTVPFRDKAIDVGDAKDGSAWSAANARYNGYFREIANRMGFRDAFLINAKGDVVYSAHKGVELGTNVLTGRSGAREGSPRPSGKPWPPTTSTTSTPPTSPTTCPPASRPHGCWFRSDRRGGPPA